MERSKLSTTAFSTVIDFLVISRLSPREAFQARTAPSCTVMLNAPDERERAEACRRSRSGPPTSGTEPVKAEDVRRREAKGS
jgi:hypothetical protein